MKGDLQPRVSSRAKPVTHVDRRANDGGRATNMCFIDRLGDDAHGLRRISSKGRPETETDYNKAKADRTAPAVMAIARLPIIDNPEAGRRHRTNSSKFFYQPKDDGERALLRWRIAYVSHVRLT